MTVAPEGMKGSFLPVLKALLSSQATHRTWMWVSDGGEQ